MRTVARWLVLAAALVYGGAFFLGGAMSMLQDPEIFHLAMQHFAATIGLPSAALAALFLVVFLEHTSGAIEFEAIGFKFKGASGPIVMWALAFIVITIAIKLLW